jgi:uncharacterized protein YdeI (YjbR/CyaY-like superfamily)
MNPKVDFYFSKGKWQAETSQLRKIILDCGLIEDLKWGVPCYTLKGANVILIHNFKEYTAVLFHKGVLLKDTENILIQQTENVQSARQIRFTTLQEIIDLEKVLKAYVFEAIEVEKAGLKVELKKTKDYDVPEELQVKLDENQALKEAFENLTPGRQRAYFYDISQAKQSKTREARVDKYIPKILEGKGIDD